MKPVVHSIITLFVLSIVFTSCEKMEYLRSEKSVSKQLQGKWSLVPIPQTKPAEIWTFSNNLVYRSIEASGVMTPVDTGNYTINTYTSKVIVEIKNFKRVLDELNGNWQVVQLDDDYLIIATDHYGSSGVLQREFTRIK